MKGGEFSSQISPLWSPAVLLCSYVNINGQTAHSHGHPHTDLLKRVVHTKLLIWEDHSISSQALTERDLSFHSKHQLISNSFTNLEFPHITSISNIYMYIYKYQSTPWRWYSYMHFAPFALNSSKYKTGVSSFWFVFYGFAVLNFVIGCDFCVGLICFPSLMCNCFVCCGGGGCCVVVSRFMEYSHLYPTVSKDTALCAGVRPCVARRCHGEWGLVSWDSYPAASSTSATTFPSATFHFLWL